MLWTSSFPVSGIKLSLSLLVIDLVSHYPTNYLLRNKWIIWYQLIYYWPVRHFWLACVKILRYPSGGVMIKHLLSCSFLLKNFTSFDAYYMTYHHNSFILIYLHIYIFEYFIYHIFNYYTTYICIYIDNIKYYNNNTYYIYILIIHIYIRYRVLYIFTRHTHYIL